MIIAVSLSLVIIFIWWERRLMGRFQLRLGPNRCGPEGIFQPMATGLKLLLKEDIVPAKADKMLHFLAPIVVFVPVLMIFAVVPVGQGAILADLNVGIIYVIAISSISAIGIFMAAWGSSNKFSLISGMRTIAQMVSYELPVVLSIVGVALVTGSFSMLSIVQAQSIPFILLMPLGGCHLLPGLPGRDEPLALRPAGSRFGDSGRLPYRVLRHEICHVLHG